MVDMAKVDELNYQLDNLTLAALACGNKDHQPVLCLHGYLDNAASFLPFIEQVIKHNSQQTAFLANRRVIALDWPGHGQSEHRSLGAHYHFFDYISDLVSLFSHNNWPAIDIVAHSMGAMVATAFAAAFPEKVKSLTLIDSFGFVCASAEETTKQLREGILSRTNKASAQRSFSQKTAVKARLNVSDLQEEHAQLIVKRSLILVENQSKTHDNKKPTSVLYRWRSDPRLRTISPYRLTPSQGKQLLKDIKCPVQLIYGDKGMSMVIEGLSMFSTSLKDFTAIKISGGHHVHMEQTEQLCNLVNNFYQVNEIKTSV